ncbi:uncharacterized protein N0V89_001340 [Didymosphaeria variabile]|uniref:Calcineurin-like phosphoesterase domain-containing protein n=1 Tax=Didymosphaeria variabile TaxID=1932322 RepID=A0A9W8XWZ3_9PLEO|nr:uncharacterized protein N0V89_001340 [Didymosphaeria variabile]KAJ4360773.1 hypothetical protein N0V89_001340 [Didymosphaeria variabile]
MMTTAMRKTRKTRIVCISDTHNQTPKLPQGDVLIHAGDMTKQGSRHELEKTVRWLEAADFEAKIVVAGNHDMTLDAPFFEQHNTRIGSSHPRWPDTRSSEDNKRLLAESTSITYLENEAATIYLNAKDGPHTCFKVYGSPNVPNNRDWGFAYKPGTARKIWDAIPLDTDIAVTHTPPLGHCDKAVQDERTGCEELLHALHRVRPMLSVFGHIHEARGVERVRWNLESPGKGSLTDGVEVWQDPGMGKKQSMVDLTARGRRPLDNHSRLTRQTYSPRHLARGEPPGGGLSGLPGVIQPSQINATSSSEGVGGEVSGGAKFMLGGAIEHRQGVGASEVGPEHKPDVDADERRETVMINAAFLGPHHLKTTFNKPIVVDVDLPVWVTEDDAG